MRWFEMLHTEVSPGQEENLIQWIQTMLQAGVKEPVVTAMFWRHATLATNFCVIIHCEDSSEHEVTQIRSLVGHEIFKIMRSTGLVKTDVWSELKDSPMEVWSV